MSIPLSAFTLVYHEGGRVHDVSYDDYAQNLWKGVFHGDENVVWRYGVHYLLGLSTLSYAQNQIVEMPILHTAVEKGYESVVDMLLYLGVDANVPSYHFPIDYDGNFTTYRVGGAPLHAAVYRGHYYIIQKLINAGAHIHQRTHLGDTPLHVAARCGQTQILRYLLQNHADVDATNTYGETPLCQAIRGGSFQAVCHLISEKIAISNDIQYINTPNEAGKTPLRLAVDHCNINIVQLLISSGADIIVADSMGDTPVHGAVIANAFDIFTLLLKNGAPVRVHNICGHTPLHIAAELERYEMALLLIQAGACIQCYDVFGETPYMIACRSPRDNTASVYGRSSIRELIGEVVPRLAQHGNDTSSFTVEQLPEYKEKNCLAIMLGQGYLTNALAMSQQMTQQHVCEAHQKVLSYFLPRRHLLAQPRMAFNHFQQGGYEGVRSLDQYLVCIAYNISEIEHRCGKPLRGSDR